MSAGYSGTPLPRKLGIKEGHTVVAIAAPEHLGELLGELPRGAQLRSGEGAEEEIGPREADVILCFCADAVSLPDRFADAHPLLAWDGGLWICWPKLGSHLSVDLRDGDVRRHGLAAGLVDNKVCAIDADWSGLRFVYRREDRPRVATSG